MRENKIIDYECRKNIHVYFISNNRKMILFIILPLNATVNWNWMNSTLFDNFIKQMIGFSFEKHQTILSHLVKKHNANFLQTLYPTFSAIIRHILLLCCFYNLKVWQFPQVMVNYANCKKSCIIWLIFALICNSGCFFCYHQLPLKETNK